MGSTLGSCRLVWRCVLLCLSCWKRGLTLENWSPSTLTTVMWHVMVMVVMNLKWCRVGNGLAGLFEVFGAEQDGRDRYGV
ncbi:hypothetical protein L208DRAFT_1410526 [Tricholoma matsutake]|nr:hypothetical protein L208DRAFT_1410526 [Tricholoma matsutake 945]